MKDKDWLVSQDFWEGEEVYLAGGGEMAVRGVTGSVLFRTSGSVGEEKLVVLKKSAMKISAQAVNEWLGVREASRWGVALPLDHVGGFAILARVYMAGCGVCFHEGKWNPGGFVKWLERERVTHVSLVPAQVCDLVRGDLYAPSMLEVVVVGGGGLNQMVESKARELGWPVRKSYGMTETGSQIATQREAGGGMEVLPIWDVEVEDGLLVVTGEALFEGYVQNGLLVKRDGAFRSNDRVTLDGRVIHFEGRADRLVKVLGVMVDLDQVERGLREGAESRECVVVALPDERREHVLAAVFEGEVDGRLVERYNAGVSGLERIGVCDALDEFPRSALGKIQRGRVIEMLSARG